VRSLTRRPVGGQVPALGKPELAEADTFSPALLAMAPTSTCSRKAELGSVEALTVNYWSSEWEMISGPLAMMVVFRPQRLFAKRARIG
jgi:hypothetical protein